MEPDHYDFIAAIERDHWWYHAVRWTVGSLLDGRQRIDGAQLRILDLGAGTGAASSDFDGVVALDKAEESIGFLRDRQVTAIRAEATALPIAAASFDVVLAVNLLYSVVDPQSVLSEAARVLVPGGAVVLIEPAFPSFERAHDRRVHGRRRFRRPGLNRALQRAGLDVHRGTYFFSFGAPAAAVQGLVFRLFPTVGEVPASINRPPLDQLLGLLALLERALLRRIDLPIGTSVAMLAERSAGTPGARAGALGHHQAAGSTTS